MNKLQEMGIPVSKWTLRFLFFLSLLFYMLMQINSCIEIAL
jgi:hypothetical protein